MPYAAPARGLSPREASLLQCAAVVRRASCTQSRILRGTRARHCAGYLWGGGAAHELAAHAHPAALVVAALCPMQRHYNGERPLSLSARSWCDVPAARSNAQPTFASHMRTRHCAGCLSGVGAAHELAARARRAVLVVVGARRMQGHCVGNRPFYFSARPWCDVPAAASHAQATFAWHARARARAVALAVS